MVSLLFSSILKSHTNSNLVASISVPLYQCERTRPRRRWISPSATSGDLPPPLDEITGAANPATAARQRGSLAVYFHNLRHMRDATAEERLAELRRLHSANQEAGATGRATDVDRERRLSTRLPDAFRIRTRRQEGDNASVSEADPQAEPLEQGSTGT